MVVVDGQKSGKDRQMKIYDPGDLPSMVDKAIENAKKDKKVSFELLTIMNEFMTKLDLFNRKYGEKDRFQFRIEPIRFEDLNDE